MVFLNKTVFPTPFFIPRLARPSLWTHPVFEAPADASQPPGAARHEVDEGICEAQKAQGRMVYVPNALDI